MDSGAEFRRLVPGGVVYGMGDTLEDVRKTLSAERNLVVSPSGLKIARMLKREYGMPYETGYPVEAESRREFTERILPELGSHILIVHQQIFANEIRKWIRERKPDAKVTVAGWFRIDGT